MRRQPRARPPSRNGGRRRARPLEADARSIPSDSELSCDLCIVGAGAAGIALALELDGSGIDVLLLESGGFEQESATQQLAAGHSTGHPGADLEISRLRLFGGSTNHWGGFCRPFDEQDFIERSWVPESGWPIRRADLDPYYRRAHPLIELDEADYGFERWRSAVPPIFAGPLFERKLEPVVFQLSPPTDMGVLHRDRITSSGNIRLLLHANAVDLVSSSDTRRVEKVRIACLDGTRFHIRTGAVVLAAGGIDNPRLLLASRSVATAGVGNTHDLVGRFYMDHPSHEAANIFLRSPTSDARRPAFQRAFAQAGLRPQVERDEKILRFLTSIHVGLEMFEEPESYRAFREIFMAFGHFDWPDDFGEQARIFIGDIDGAIRHGYQRYLADAEAFGLRVHAETVPNRESRIMLADDTDALGVPRALRDWRLSELDRHTIRRGLEIIGEEAGRIGLGRLRFHDWVMQDPLVVPGGGSWHHIGTTRMHNDPRRGVVDADCRVHGVDNLFIAGSSVFPTSGMANPTLTILALAIRLADHLKAWRPGSR
ncbi:MAG: GMC family oxidoreductase [Geminicoccaceae bacterium]